MSTLSVHGLELELAAFSEQGPRPENQDAFALDRFAESHVLAVADGMGGEKSGRVAADTALEALERLAPIRSVDAARRAVREANDQVVRASAADPDAHGGMGCALAFLSLANNGDGPGWIAGHVGDVRILSRSPDGVLRLETRDHTPAFARWEAGEISLDEIPDSAGANRLQRAVGRGGEADVSWIPAAAGWSWLIVSDGIYKAMRLDELARAMAAPSAAETCETIRRKVDERGADDNFTAVAVRAVGRRAAAATATADPDSSTTLGGMTTLTRHESSRLPLLLAIPALLLAAVALWLAIGASSANAELDRLRTEVDSLRAVVRTLSEPADPFGPSVPGQSTVPGTSTTPSSR